MWEYLIFRGVRGLIFLVEGPEVKMKLAIQEGLVPGRDFAEKLANLEKLGFDGVEIGGRELWNREKELTTALASSSVKLSTICAGYRGCVLDPDPAERQLAIDDIRRILDVAGSLGAVGLIFVPIFGPPRIPDLSPYRDPVTLEKELLVRILKRLAPHAKSAGTYILVEPLNRYETHLIRRLEDAVEICQKVNHPSVQIMADFFHMNIEEPVVAESIKKAGRWIKHIHLADSTRSQPGTGHTDFKAGFSALRSVKFNWYMALECAVTGDDRMKDLRKCVSYLRECMES